MTVKKESGRTKYNPDGKNRYDAPKEKPPRRYDRGKRHRYNDDPLEKRDNHQEKEMNRRSTEEDLIETASNERKEAARRIIYRHATGDFQTKIARNVAKSEKGFNLDRQGLENFKYKEKGMKAVAKSYKHLADAFLEMTKCVNTFTSCKSSEVSPDGKLGGRGYVQPIREIRTSLAECINIMSDLIDTFHDECNSPYWKRVTVEDHPAVREILDDADKLVDRAEDLDQVADPRSPENIVLSEDEKKKVLDILNRKGFF